jgi:hypothetical protein
VHHDDDELARGLQTRATPSQTGWIGLMFWIASTHAAASKWIRGEGRKVARVADLVADWTRTALPGGADQA